MAVEFTINGQPASVDAADAGIPLLWFVRETLELKGTKFGCGIGQCGACTVHVDGVATRSCVTPVSSLGGKAVTTIEGLGAAGAMHPVQRAWLELDVAQCGYCQPGQIMAAAALIAAKPKPADADIDAGVTNICRCGTYVRIRQAIRRAAELHSATGANPAS
jgi:isoquinoline 1-oxidoreductase alpha subunit